MSEKEILLIGGGGHCRSCIDVIEAEGKYTIGGIVEKTGASDEKTVSGYKVIGYDNDLEQLRGKFQYALITVGQIGAPGIRKTLFGRLKSVGFVFPVIVSPHAVVSENSIVGEGTVVMHHAVVNSGARVGENCILNTKALVEHDVVVGGHTHISTAYVINGGAKLGSDSFVGSNATVVHEAVLPDRFFLKAGSLVKDQKHGQCFEMD